MDGRATDVPVLGPMEWKMHFYLLLFFYHFFFFFFGILLTCKLQIFLRTGDRIIISWDTAAFVQKGKLLHKFFEDKLQKYVSTDREAGNQLYLVL